VRVVGFLGGAKKKPVECRILKRVGDRKEVLLYDFGDVLQLIQRGRCCTPSPFTASLNNFTL
jgi:hypothetical protein